LIVINIRNTLEILQGVFIMMDDDADRLRRAADYLEAL
jgi:hypothetical protein